MAPPLTPIGLCLPCLGHESYLASLVSTASVAAASSSTWTQCFLGGLLNSSRTTQVPEFGFSDVNI